jgi:hypothetical protein
LSRSRQNVVDLISSKLRDLVSARKNVLLVDEVGLAAQSGGLRAAGKAVLPSLLALARGWDAGRQRHAVTLSRRGALIFTAESAQVKPKIGVFRGRLSWVSQEDTYGLSLYART